MAADSVLGQRSRNRRKLLLNEKVEVRSLDVGFHGSWHPGIVVDCGNRTRQVKYDYLLADDSLDRLVEFVTVSAIINGGASSASGVSCHSRGLIRPSPPTSDCSKWSVHYGLCVDAFYMDAWWEGVIFDNEDGSEMRKIFFPDLGDELMVEINLLRITQDWNEATEVWERRGNWLFLELIEEYEQEWPICVSIKQIWYDARLKKGFEKLGDWTSLNKSVWRELVLEVIGDSFKLTLDEFYILIEELESFSPAADAELLNSTAVIPVDNTSQLNSHLVANCENAMESLDCNMEVVKKMTKNHSSSAGHSDLKLNSIQNIEAVFNEEDINLNDLDFVKSNELGLDMDLLMNPYFSCNDEEGHVEPQALSILPSDPDGISSMSTYNEGFSAAHAKKVNGTSSCSTHKKRQIWLPAGTDILPGAEFCPDAISEYALCSVNNQRPSNSLTTNLRKHLSYLGWKIEFKKDKGGLSMRYTSPDGTSYRSLRSICKNLREPLGEIHSPIFEDDHKSSCASPYGLVGIARQGQKKEQDACFPKVKKRKVCEAPIVGANYPNGMLRSRKLAQQVGGRSSLRYNPRTVLSWLIDNNVVLPRAKVYYRCTKDHRSMAEGCITRDGIKCSCCQKVFTLSSFEAHAGSTYHRPAANIFLEDGRSLLECQMQEVHNSNMRCLTAKPNYREEGNRHYSENDYICSVCHYGGNLILCDQCPSSFHMDCLGLKDVPAGDWFCPSCCCGICGQGKLNGNTDNHIDQGVLNCDQCERQYHVGCLQKVRPVMQPGYPKGNHYCSKVCEKIYLKLHRLLGKPVPVGAGNLTWTLLKSSKYDKHDLDMHDIEASAENYSKLNVALSVIHECFEPTKDPLSRRDIAEDVIFSRGSELKRLNFRGFYTVLLERNDELISVANVRIHGKKVAEVPLVGTRFQFRRLGMCRILMNELEKKLKGLGVERMVLPAVPSVLNTWTISFGFSKMTDSERLEFLSYTFLDFQDTVMCQKLLVKIPDMGSRGTRHKLLDDIVDNVDTDGYNEKGLCSGESPNDSIHL